MLVAEFDEGELEGAPALEVDAETADRRHQDREGGRRLVGVVAARDAIIGDLDQPVEGELARRVGTVDRIARAGKRSGAERREIGMPKRGKAPRPVALEVIGEGEEIVAERDRLGVLPVGIAGHDRVGVARGELEGGRAEIREGLA